jgi:hypothetical protein
MTTTSHSDLVHELAGLIDQHYVSAVTGSNWESVGVPADVEVTPDVAVDAAPELLRTEA